MKKYCQKLALHLTIIFFTDLLCLLSLVNTNAQDDTLSPHRTLSSLTLAPQEYNTAPFNPLMNTTQRTSDMETN